MTFIAVYSQQSSAIFASQYNLLLAPNVIPLESMNKTKNTLLEEWLNEAQKAEFESEISGALKPRANYLTRIGDRCTYLCL